MSLVSVEDLPTWYTTIYPNIDKGYRAPRSPYSTFLSMFEWHNETLNIYTHLLPGFFWLFGLLTSRAPECSPECKYLFYAGHFGAAVMGISSGIGHTFFIVNREWNSIVWTMDFTGIIAVNYSHVILDSYILFKLILKSVELCYIAFFLETVATAWYIHKIWNCLTLHLTL